MNEYVWRFHLTCIETWVFAATLLRLGSIYEKQLLIAKCQRAYAGESMKNNLQLLIDVVFFFFILIKEDIVFHGQITF